MAQPIDYTIPSPTGAFQNAFAFGTAVAEQDAARARAAEERLRAQKAQEALQSVATDRSPENIARVFRDFPALKEQISASESVLNEAQKTADNQFRATVIGLAKSGNMEAAKAKLVAQAEGYANTVGKEKEAAAAQALLKTFDIDPDSVIIPMTIQLAESNKDLYKTLFDTGELTAFQKNQRAAGVDPKSPKGMAQAEQFLNLQIDPIVEMVTPDNVKFVGPRSEYFRRYGTNAQEPVVKALPAVGEVRNGYRFNGGDPAQKSNWSKVGKSGGQTEAPSGNFQGK